MNSENLDSWGPSGKKKRQIRDPETRGRQNSRLRDSKIPRKRDFETHQKRFWFRDRTKIFRDPRFRLFFGLHTCPDLYCDLHNTIDQVLTVLPSLTIKRKIYVDFKQNWLVSSTNWKLGECVRQWFHWTIHVIFLQTRLNLKTKVKHRYQFLGWPRKSPRKICGEANSGSAEECILRTQLGTLRSNDADGNELELGYGPLKFSFRRVRLHLTK